MDQVFPLRFCILQTIKNWTVWEQAEVVTTLVTVLDDCLVIEYCTAVCLLNFSGCCHSNRIFFGVCVWTTIQHNLQLSDCELYLKDPLFHLIWFVVNCVCTCNSAY